jgi:glycosyltransferase involved in cell wall biosynthesis
MACGTPVLTSNSSALPEIAGDAALLVEPTSVEHMADAMRRIVCDAALRQLLQERGLAQSSQFSWTETTAKVQQILTRNAQPPVEKVC